MIKKILIFIFTSLLVISCSKPELTHTYDDYHPLDRDDRRDKNLGSLVTGSDEPIIIYGAKKKKESSGATVGSSFLWKAALETMSFIPLASADSNGGVILTEWYNSPDKSDERFKFNVLIVNSELQITSVKVKAFKQVLVSGNWKPAHVADEFERNMEEVIVQKAITLRNASGKK